MQTQREHALQRCGPAKRFCLPGTRGESRESPAAARGAPSPDLSFVCIDILTGGMLIHLINQASKWDEASSVSELKSLTVLKVLGAFFSSSFPLPNGGMIALFSSVSWMEDSRHYKCIDDSASCIFNARCI